MYQILFPPKTPVKNAFFKKRHKITRTGRTGKETTVTKFWKLESKGNYGKGFNQPPKAEL